GKTIPVKTDAGARYLLRTVSLDRLLKMEATRPVLTELLFRAGVPDEHRRRAARDLAKLHRKPEAKVLLDALTRIDAREEDRDESVIFDLVRLLTTNRGAAELAAVRADLENLALKAKQPVIREIGFVALVNGDGSADKAWALALKSVPSLIDMVNAVPLIGDAGLRASLYPKV